MENASDDINRFSNPNANANATATTSTSSFTFSTPSVSGLSRPRFVKVRKPNNAPAFNPFLNGAAATNAAFATTDFASRIGDPFRNLKIGEGFDAKGEFAFATNASSRVDENSVSEQINNLKIVTDNESNELDLRNELKKKLSIKEGRGSNAAVAENSAHEVVYQLKNLNVNDAIGSNVHKSAVDVKPSLENVTTFQNRETEAADLLRKVEMLNLVKEKEDCVEPNLCNPFVEGIHPRVASCGAQVASEDFGMYQSAASSSASASASVFFQPAGVGKREEFVFTGKQDISGSSFVEFNTPAPKIGKDGKLKEKGSKVRINKSREKLKHYSSAQPWHGLGFFF